MLMRCAAQPALRNQSKRDLRSAQTRRLVKHDARAGEERLARDAADGWGRVSYGCAFMTYPATQPNVCLHYAFDLWGHRVWRKQAATGEVNVVRYADDFIVGFQYRSDAERFLKELRERLQKFGLALHPGKTRFIEFGRFAAANRQRRGDGKPETFDFLGFTHYCGRTRKNGKFVVGWKTIGKRLRTKIQEVAARLRTILDP